MEEIACLEEPIGFELKPIPFDSFFGKNLKLLGRIRNSWENLENLPKELENLWEELNESSEFRKGEIGINLSKIISPKD